MATELQQAIAVIKSGDKEAGRHLLAGILRADPGNEIAWLWMSGVVDSDEQRRTCLERVLAINPNNETAWRGLEKMGLPVVPLPAIQPVPASAASLQPEALSPLQALKVLGREATKKCPYCAETIKAEALRCRFCGSDLTGQAKPSLQLTLAASPAETLPPGHLSVEQRRQILDRAVASEINQGFTLANRTETTANLVKPKKFSCLWFVLLGFIPYVLWYGLVERDKTLFLEVGPQGEIFRDGFRVAKAGTKQKPASAWRGPMILTVALIGLFLLCILLALLPAMFVPSRSSSEKSQVSLSPGAPSMPGFIHLLQEFDDSQFCHTYNCRFDDSWSLRSGGINNSYNIDVSPAILVEVTTLDQRPVGFGLMFMERPSLDSNDLQLVYSFLHSINPGVEVDPSVEAFIAQNIENGVPQICEANSIPFGSMQIWAGKVGNEQIVSVEQSCPK